MGRGLQGGWPFAERAERRMAAIGETAAEATTKDFASRLDLVGAPDSPGQVFRWAPAVTRTPGT
jgi:hypothetical protein